MFRYRWKHAQTFRNMCSYFQRNAPIARDGQWDLALITPKKQKKLPTYDVFVESRSALTAPFSTINKFTQVQCLAAARAM